MSEFGCYCGDYEEPEFCLVIEVSEAHKWQRCSECGKTIQVGQPLRRITGKWGGEIDRFYHCETCADLWDSLKSVECVAYGGLYEIYEEFLDYYSPQPMNIHWTHHPDGTWTKEDRREDEDDD